MSYFLLLDDCRSLKEITWIELPLVEWTTIRSHKDFVRCLNEKGIPNIVTYDCDLHESHYESYFNKSYIQDWPHFRFPCGIDCCIELIKRCKTKNIKHPEFYIHSMNLVGGQYIKGLIDQYNKKFEEIS